MSNYLRNRPFLLVKQSVKPVKGAPTNVKGWMDNEDNFVINELVSIVDAVRDKHRIESTLIIDIMKQEIIKNNIDKDHNPEVLAHYMKKYNAQITEGTQIWMQKMNANNDMDKVEQMLNAFGIDMPTAKVETSNDADNASK